MWVVIDDTGGQRAYLARFLHTLASWAHKRTMCCHVLLVLFHEICLLQERKQAMTAHWPLECSRSKCRQNAAVVCNKNHDSAVLLSAECRNEDERLTYRTSATGGGSARSGGCTVGHPTSLKACSKNTIDVRILEGVWCTCSGIALGCCFNNVTMCKSVTAPWLAESINASGSNV